MGSTQSYHWTVRLTTDEQFEKIEQYFPDTVFGAYVVESGNETGKRHYHIALSFKEPKSRNQLNKQISAFFPQSGNEYRAIKLWKSGNDLASDDFLQYMHKSNRPSFWGTRVGLKTHEEYESLARQVSRAVKKHQTMLDDMLVEITKMVREQLSDADIRNMGISRIRTLVVDCYYDFHMSNKRKFKSIYHIGTDLMNIIAMLDAPAGRDSIKAAMRAQLSRFDEPINF